MREFNLERALILAIAVLRKEPGISRAREIKKRINRRLDLWEAGKIAELVNDVENTAKRSGGTARGEEDDDAIARRYHSMVIDGRLRQAVRSATDRTGGGVLSPEAPTRRPGGQSSTC